MEKKSLINTLKTTKKASLASAPAKNEGTSTRKAKMARRARADFKRLGKVSLQDLT